MKQSLGTLHRMGPHAWAGTLVVALLSAHIASTSLRARLIIAPSTQPIVGMTARLPSQPDQSELLAAGDGLFGRAVAPASFDRGTVQADRATPVPALPRVSLLGTMRGGGASLAMVKLDADLRSVRVGDTIGAWRLVEIRDLSVKLRNGSTDVDVAVGQTVGTSSAASVPSPTAAAGPKSDSVELSESRWRILLVGGTRADLVPQDRGGLRVSRMEPMSPLAAVGIEVGDTLLAINNTPADFDHASTLVDMLRNEKHLVVRLERGDGVRVIDVRIQ